MNEWYDTTWQNKFQMSFFVCYNDTDITNHYSQFDVFKKRWIKKDDYLRTNHQQCILLIAMRIFEDEVQIKSSNIIYDWAIRSNKDRAKQIKSMFNFLTIDHEMTEKYLEIKDKVIQLMQSLQAIKVSWLRIISTIMSNTLWDKFSMKSIQFLEMTMRDFKNQRQSHSKTQIAIDKILKRLYRALEKTTKEVCQVTTNDILQSRAKKSIDISSSRDYRT